MSSTKTKIEDLQFDANQSTGANGGVVIGHLSGPVADIVNTTRNGRKYSEELWDKVFKDPITQEYFNCGGIFGELGHPADREETDMEKIALCMPKAPEKKNGKLWATFDILDTPNGRILKTLCQYGYKMGISSRGSGDLVTDYDGQESVDPDTYQFNAFDAVLLPAVKEARLNFTESLHNNKPLKKALVESFEAATADEKKIMRETFDTLNIELTEASEEEKELSEGTPLTEADHYRCDFKLRDKSTGEYLKSEYGMHRDLTWYTADSAIRYMNEHPEEDLQLVYVRYKNNIVDAEKPMTEAVDVEIIEEDKYTRQELFDKFGTDNLDIINAGNEEDVELEEVDNNESIIDDLQEALKAKAELENKVVELQEKLSVCYAKETSLNESLATTKSNVKKLAEDAKKAEALDVKVSKLSEQVQKGNEKLEATVSNRRALQERLATSVKQTQSLKDQLKLSQKEVAKLNKENAALSESVANLQKDFELKKSEYSKKLTEAKAVVEKQKKIANKAVDKYIESCATRIGVSSNEIKNKLSESYTFNDIDKICEDLQSYQLSMSKLPFNTSIRENLKIKATSSQNDSLLPAMGIADDVDDDLLQLAGL